MRTSKAFLTIGREWEAIKNDRPIYPDHVEDDAVTEHIESGLSAGRFLLGEWDYDKQVLRMRRYSVVGDTIIGKGGFGRVYKVKDRKGVVMAAKVMELTKAFDYQKNRFAAFKHEVVILRKHNHKNIIKVFDHFICDRTISFIIMEFAEGGNLEERLRRNLKPFDEEEAKGYFVQISAALYYLHGNGIAHNDLKLSNILIWIGSTGEVIKVTDFGCSRQAIKDDSGLIMATKTHGTVPYMSPEQIRIYISQKQQPSDILPNITARPYSPLKADMWALGVCLYKFLCYNRPFACKRHRNPNDLYIMLKSMENGFKMPEQVFLTVSQECIDLLKGLLEADESNRYDIRVVMTTKWVTSSPLFDPNQLNLKTVF